MQRETEDTAFIEALVELGELRAQVEEELFVELAVLVQEVNRADLIRDEQTTGAVREGN